MTKGSAAVSGSNRSKRAIRAEISLSTFSRSRTEGGTGKATVLMGVQLLTHIVYVPKVRDHDDDFAAEGTTTVIAAPEAPAEAAPVAAAPAPVAAPAVEAPVAAPVAAAPVAPVAAPVVAAPVAAVATPALSTDPSNTWHSSASSWQSEAY